MKKWFVLKGTVSFKTSRTTDVERYVKLDVFRTRSDRAVVGRLPKETG